MATQLDINTFNQYNENNLWLRLIKNTTACLGVVITGAATIGSVVTGLGGFIIGCGKSIDAIESIFESNQGLTTITNNIALGGAVAVGAIVLGAIGAAASALACEKLLNFLRRPEETAKSNSYNL